MTRDDGNLVAAAIDAAEEIVDPLDGLLEKTTADPGAPFTPEVLERASHWMGGVVLTAAFVVLDHRRREFADLDEIISKAGLRLAIPDDRYFRGRFQRLFPLAEFVPVDGLDALVGSAAIHVDAMIFAAEMASAWTLIHPEFSVVVPDAATQRIPMAFLLPQGDSDWANTVNTWVELKKRDGTIEQLYDHWVLGRAADQHRPRWSIIRDVLHWTD
jgi:hypothetical protein